MIQLIIISSIVLALLGFTVSNNKPKKFTEMGNKEYCLVNYDNKQIECLYKSMRDCQEQFLIHSDAICFKNKELK